jgi:D-glycero-D-manno-heptose 1,7-bisphosphate phosphatase
VKRRALFLDRDGVINIDHGYVHRAEQFEFVDGIFDLCRAAHQDGWLLIVATNQAGIARGLYGEDAFHRLTEWMLARFVAEGAPITDVYYCPTHPTAGRGEYRRESFRRKPNPGMLFEAAQKHDLDLSVSVLLGDKETDMQAGRAAGVGTLILLTSSADDVDAFSVPALRVDTLRRAQAVLATL